MKSMIRKAERKVDTRKDTKRRAVNSQYAMHSGMTIFDITDYHKIIQFSLFDLYLFDLVQPILLLYNSSLKWR